MVQLNGAGPEGAQVHHLPPRPSSRGSRGGVVAAKDYPSVREKRTGTQDPGKIPRRSSRIAPHWPGTDGAARRDPVGGEERGFPPVKRRTPSPRTRAESPASIASSRPPEAPSRRRHRLNGAYHHPYPDQYGSREMYDQHSHYYYYYQKYLEQDPFYREYYRQYYRRYGYNTGDSLVDDKASTRSGRSSVNDELKRSSLSSGNVSGVPSVTDDAGSDTHQRLSPHLFTGPHITASFTSGGRLLLVLPNDPKDGERPTVQVRNVQKMLAVNPGYATRIHKLGSYPGPLTAKETHKDTVLRFCEDKAKAALSNQDLFDRESVVLMWEYLSLLVKQNGNVCGADLANLLIKRCSTGGISNEGTGSQEQLKDLHNEGSLPDQEQRDAPLPEKLTSAQVPCTPSQGDINKFTEFLCLGRKKEAVDYAIQKGLWSYAMVLSAKMDPGTHTRVMSAFVHSIPSTDVLQTLIQHLSGKKPEVTKNYCEDRWGDWRQHLAMMVSNPTGNPQRDRASIIALGDTLAARNRLHAAHLCYLAAKFEWGTYSNKESRLVLIGSSPTQPFQVFASDDAIQCTEIYEFARSLDTSNPLFRTFQSYKLIYALRLTECAFPMEALKYCEVIGSAVTKEPTAFQVEFVSQVLELASQLKYHDVHYQMGEGEAADMPDPKWIRNLQEVLYQLQCQAVDTDSASAISAHQITDTTHSHTPALESYSSPDGGPMGSHAGRVQLPEMEHQGEHLYLAAAATPDYGTAPNTASLPEYEGRMSASDNYDSMPQSLKKKSIPGGGGGGPQSLPVEGFGSQQQPAYQPYLPPQQSNEPIYSNHPLSWTGQPQLQQQPWQTQTQPPISTSGADQLYPNVDNHASLQWMMQQQQQQQQHHPLQQQPQQQQPLQQQPQQQQLLQQHPQQQQPLQQQPPQQQPLQQQPPQQQSLQQQPPQQQSLQQQPQQQQPLQQQLQQQQPLQQQLQQQQSLQQHPQQQQPPYQNLSWQSDGSNDAQWQQQTVMSDPSGTHEERSGDPAPPAAPSRSAEEEEYWALMTGKDRGTPQLAENQEKNDEAPPKKSEDEPEGKTEDKKSFFGSLFGGWRKSSNQANLPDDKNPSIVWNEQTKKWENKDGETNDEAALPPPPSSISAAVTPQAMGTLRGGNRKSRYVDPVGEKGRTKVAVTPMLPPMPTAATAPLSVAGMNPSEHQPLEGSRAPLQNFTHSEGSTGLPHIPQTAIPAHGQLISHPGVEEIKNAVDNAGDAIPMMNLGATQAPPMFINPAQFQPPANQPSVQPKRSGPARRTFNVQR